MGAVDNCVDGLQVIFGKWQASVGLSSSIEWTDASPLPGMSKLGKEDGDIAVTEGDKPSFVALTAAVDGTPVPLAMSQRAFVGERDVTRELEDANVPVAFWTAYSVRIIRTARRGHQPAPPDRHVTQNSA